MQKSQVFVLDNISFQLKEEHDFSWIKDLGEVFCVFDQQDSGNICFGIKQNGTKRFVKYAGAKTIAYNGSPEKAIENLEKSIRIYEDLQHPSLVNLITHFKVEMGYVVIFDWFEGECLHSHWSFPPPLKYTHPNSPFYQFKQLPLDLRINALNKIFEFHVFVEKNDYVAVDFYDGSILYDFKNNTIKLCDIDLYKKKPFYNKMGRMWGSSRFMSPEEFEMNATIDEVTNVFNMGAVAFSLLGGELDRDFAKWEASSEQYEVALKAVNKDRKQRYSTVHEFSTDWLLANRTEDINS